MDAYTFDELTARLARRPNRRGALRLLGGGMLAGLLGYRGAVSASALQRSDRDGDGLFDDDETDVYGTNPDNPDTDGDGIDDGQEVFDGTDPLAPNGGGEAPAPPPPVEQAPPPPAPAPVDEACPVNMIRCDGVCVYPYSDDRHCGRCHYACTTIFCTYRPEGICYTYCNAGTCEPYYQPGDA